VEKAGHAEQASRPPPGGLRTRSRKISVVSRIRVLLPPSSARNDRGPSCLWSVPGTVTKTQQNHRRIVRFHFRGVDRDDPLRPPQVSRDPAGTTTDEPEIAIPSREKSWSLCFLRWRSFGGTINSLASPQSLPIAPPSPARRARSPLNTTRGRLSRQPHQPVSRPRKSPPAASIRQLPRTTRQQGWFSLDRRELPCCKRRSPFENVPAMGASCSLEPTRPRVKRRHSTPVRGPPSTDGDATVTNDGDERRWTTTVTTTVTPPPTT